MVRLTKIYTKTGDKGKTSLASGKRVAKDHIRIKSYGSVDELNSILGIVRHAISKKNAKVISEIQNDFLLNKRVCKMFQIDFNLYLDRRVRVADLLPDL